MKRRRRRSFSWHLIWLFLSLVALASLLAAAVNLPIWEIRNIEVAGAQILLPREIETIASVPRAENLWLVNFSRSRKNLEKIIAIKNFRISRFPPGTVRISIEERRPIAVVMFPEESAIIDEDGFILNGNRNLTLNLPHLIDLPVISGLPKSIMPGGPKISTEVSQIISGLVLELTRFYEPKKFQIEFASGDDLSFLLDDLLRVRLGKEDISRKMSVFRKLLFEIRGKWGQVEYVDVRFPDNPVIRYRP